MILNLPNSENGRLRRDGNIVPYVFLLKFLLTIVIRLLISFILCKIFNLVLVYFIAWPPVNQFSLTEGLPCLKN